MSDQLHAASTNEEATTVESKPDSKAQPMTSASSATRTWAWGRTHAPYDWMDAHTPSDNLYAWH